MQRIASALFGEGQPTRVFPDVCPACKRLQTPLRVSARLNCEACGRTGFCGQVCFKSHFTNGVCQPARTPCHHANASSCVRKCLIGLLRGFLAGYVTKAALNGVIIGIMKRDARAFVRAFASSDPVRLGLFLAGLVGLQSGCRCALSHARGVDDRINAAVAGFVGGLCIAFDDKERRRALGLYFFFRSLYLCIRIAMRWGWLPRIRNLSVWLFGLANGPIMYSFLYDPKYLDKSYYKWILNMGNLTDSALKWSLRDSRAAILVAADAAPNPEVRRRILYEPFSEYSDLYRRCNVCYHPGHSCTVAHSTDWFSCLIRGAKIYTPVHVLPVLLFRLSQARRQPLRVLKSTAVAIAQSCTFVSTYQFTVKMMMCILRYTRRRDDWWHAVVAGNLTGLSLFWEQPKRRSELMLYCLPKAADVCWQLCVEAGWVRALPGAELLMFAIAMAVTMGVNRKDLKPALQGVLWALMGDPAHELLQLKPSKRYPLPAPSPVAIASPSAQTHSTGVQ